MEPPPKLTGAAAEAEADALPENLSIAEKLKLLWHKYGYVFIGTHFAVYFSTLAVFTVGVSNGLLGRTEEEREENLEKVISKLEPFVPTSAIGAIRKSPGLGE